MDANLNADKLVVVGDTYDSGLAGVTLNGGSAIFIVAFSISSTTIYWSKNDTSKSLLVPLSISLSPNADYAAVFINHIDGSP
jgi:hypothetical protein